MPEANSGWYPAAGEAAVRGRSVAVRGIRFYVEETPAAGPAAAASAPIVLLHGFTGSAATWQPVRAALARHGPVVAVDLIGHGRSAAPANPDRYSMAHAVADLLALWDQWGFRQVRLVGYSLGGRVALHVALAAPQRIASLVLESASAGLADPVQRERRRQEDEALAQRIQREGVAAFVEYWENLPLFASHRRLPEAVQRWLRDQRLSQRPLGLANSLRGMGVGVQESLWDRLAELRRPVLVVVGALDDKYVAIGRELVRRLPQGQLAVVSGAGHTVHLEQPEEFVAAVARFWEEGLGSAKDGPWHPPPR